MYWDGEYEGREGEHEEGEYREGEYGGGEEEYKDGGGEYGNRCYVATERQP